MKTEIWIDFVDDATPSIIFKSDEDTGPFVIPAIGEKVGWREASVGAPHYDLDYVVDVRHYVFKDLSSKPPAWKQEIHIMTSSRH